MWLEWRLGFPIGDPGLHGYESVDYVSSWTMKPKTQSICSNSDANPSFPFEKSSLHFSNILVFVEYCHLPSLFFVRPWWAFCECALFPLPFIYLFVYIFIYLFLPWAANVRIVLEVADASLARNITLTFSEDVDEVSHTHSHASWQLPKQTFELTNTEC